MEKSTLIEIWLWGSLFFPFVILFFLDSKKWMKFIPVGLVQIAFSTIVYQWLTNYGMFKAKENLFFLTDIPPKTYGILFVGTILIFYFTYGNFLKYLVVNLIMDSFFTFLFTPIVTVKYLDVHGGAERNPFLSLILMTLLSFVLYGFHKWYKQALK